MVSFLFTFIKKQNRTQVSIEFIAILTSILLVAVLFLVFIMDIPSVADSMHSSQGNQQWGVAEVGISGIFVNKTETRVHIINNNRVSIRILNMSINENVGLLDSSFVLTPGERFVISLDSVWSESILYPKIMYSFANTADLDLETVFISDAGNVGFRVVNLR